MLFYATDLKSLCDCDNYHGRTVVLSTHALHILIPLLIIIIKPIVEMLGFQMIDVAVNYQFY